jgi:quinol monooxygenase YgiN
MSSSIFGKSRRLRGIPSVLSIVTKWWIAPGREGRAVRALRRLALAIEEQEPQTTMFMVHTALAQGPRPGPARVEVVFVGAWPDREAFEQHLSGPVFNGWMAAYGDLFLADDGGELVVDSELMARRAGFVRATALEPDYEYSA